jgi:hypothetical protein
MLLSESEGVRVLKKARAVGVHGNRARAAAHETRGSQQPEGSGLCQSVHSSGAGSMARGHAREWSVGLGREC